MKFPGILEAGKANGVLTEAKYVKGSYIVCETKTDRNAIPCGVRVKGTKVYVASEEKEYRWNGSAWVALQTDMPALPSKTDGKIYGIQNGQWVEIDVEAFKAQLKNLQTEIKLVETNVDDLQGKVEHNTNFVNYLNAELDKKADKGSLPTKTSQLINDSGFITLEIAGNNFASKENVNALSTRVDNISKDVNNLNVEINKVQDSIETLDTNTVKYITIQTPEEIIIAPKPGDSVDIDDPTTPSFSPSGNTVIVQIDRKTIQLDNYDSISGLDTKGDNHNLVTITKKNVVDLGDEGLHLNLNTKDNITINNGEVLLTTKDKEELEQKIDVLQPGGTYTKAEVDEKLSYKQDTLVDGVNIKTINNQSILGKGNLVIEDFIDNLPIATVNKIGGIKSSDYESEEGIIRSVVVDPSTGLATVSVPTLEQSADQQDIVDVLNSGVKKLVINGGDSTEEE